MDTLERFERTFPPIDDWTDSREQLARARQQADKRNFDDVFIVDIDSHIGEDKSWPEVLTYIEDPVIRRSEEHTSELQSLMRISYAVFCLKQNTKNTPHKNNDGHD